MIRIGMKQPVWIKHYTNMPAPEYQITPLQITPLQITGASNFCPDVMLWSGIALHTHATRRQRQLHKGRTIKAKNTAAAPFIGAGNQRFGDRNPVGRPIIKRPQMAAGTKPLPSAIAISTISPAGARTCTADPMDRVKRPGLLISGVLVTCVIGTVT